MEKNERIARVLARMEFEQLEIGFAHHAYDVELRQYELLRAGDTACAEEGARMFLGRSVGTLSANGLHDKRYLFVAATTLATRFAIEGGLPAETAYTLSDLMIRRMDACQSVDEIAKLHRSMLLEFALRVGEARSQRRYSAPIRRALDEMQRRLSERVFVEELAEHTGLTRAYFSSRFRAEVGVSAAAYMRIARVEAAKRLLRFTDLPQKEIAAGLAFPSQSHFISVFRDHVGQTPAAYRRAALSLGGLDAGRTERAESERC